MADLIGVIQAAKEFKVNPATVRRWVHTGRIKAYKKPFSNKWLVDRIELQGLSKIAPVQVVLPQGAQTVLPFAEVKKRRTKK